MAENKNKIIVYRDWINTFESLQDDEAGKLIKHFFRYINDKNPETPDRLTTLLFEPIKQTLKRDLKKYKSICLKNSDNIKIRWNKKDTTEYDRIRPDTKHTDSDSDSDSIKEKKNINVFWDSYHLITGLNKTDKEATLKYWNKLKLKEQQKAIDNVKLYFDSLNDKKYCKKARTYLSDKNFNDEFRKKELKLMMP